MISTNIHNYINVDHNLLYHVYIIVQAGVNEWYQSRLGVCVMYIT